MVSAVTAFEMNEFFTDTQVEGPFGKWVATHRFEAVPEGTRVSDHIQYEPPGGLLGLVLTAAFIERDLQRIFAYRTAKLREPLAGRE
jgi:ligand-binding SRPBCC domain-containing protein